MMWLIGVLILLGIILFVTGLRGRLINDHPICRKCGFDLVGHQADDPKWELKGCPECGADLNQYRAVIYGARENKKVCLWLGAVICFAGMVIGGLIAATEMEQINWYRLTPASWVIRGLDSEDEVYVSDALAELDRRLKAKQLSAGRLEDLAAVVLARQADTNKSWSKTWGDLIFQMRNTGQLSDEVWAKYLEQGIVPQVSFRERVIDQLVFRIRWELRLHEGLFAIEQHATDVRVGGAKMKYGSKSTSRGYSGSKSNSTTTHSFKGFNGTIEPGMHPVSMAIEYELATNENLDEPLHEWRLAIKDEIKVEPAGTLLITLNKDKALLEKVRQAIKVLQARWIQLKTPKKPIWWSGIKMHIDFKIEGSPIAICYEVKVDDGEQPPFSVQSITARKHELTNSGVNLWEAESGVQLKAEKVKLLLIPNPKAAAREIDIQTIYGLPIEIEDVEVTYEKR